MELGFVSDTSFEIKQGRVQCIYDLSDLLKAHLVDKTFGKGLNGIYISFICKSKDFESLHKYRAKYIKSKKELEYDLKLDFDTFSSIPEESVPEYLLKVFFMSLDSNVVWKRVIDFDMDAFKSEIKGFGEKEGFSLPEG